MVYVPGFFVAEVRKVMYNYYVKQTKTKKSLGSIVAAICFGVFFVASMIVAGDEQPKASALYIYEQPVVHFH